MLQGDANYILIILAIITLFHGFENGLISLGIISSVMWYFYPVFPYVDFLFLLMITLILSQFHYYWTKKIKTAEIDTDYKGAKLNELSRAFYSLKISHDQLEKNYVVKPMSIRNSIENIVQMNTTINDDLDIDEQNALYYKNFLKLLEKSFNVNQAFVIYKNHNSKTNLITPTSSSISYGSNSKEYSEDEIYQDYLVDKAIGRKLPIYISDEDGNANSRKDGNSLFLAVIPSVVDNEIVSLLVIEKMPFMAFNKENLTSISILLEYFSYELIEQNTLTLSNELTSFHDEKFCYEYTRLKYLFEEFKVDSIVLVLGIRNELQALRVYDKVLAMLRSLDVVTYIKGEEFYHIVLLFPLHYKSSALGFLHRLQKSLEEKKDTQFTYMTFNMKQTALLNSYIEECSDG